MNSSRSKRLCFVALALGGAVGFSLLIVEVGLRLFLRPSDQYLALQPDIHAVFETEEPGVGSPSLYRTNSMGVRARDWSSDRSTELRVLAMGGSTTECLLTDQERVWTALLEGKLDGYVDGRSAWVGNIGQSGLSSRHHVVEARHVLDVYDPDVVTLLVGVNDLSSRLKNGEQFDPLYMKDADNHEQLVEQAFAVTPADTSKMRWEEDAWYQRTAVWGVLREAKYQWFGVSLAQETDGNHLDRWRQMRADGGRRSTLPDLVAALNEYEENLRSILDSVDAHGSELLLMTQPFLWREDLNTEEESLLWMGGEGEFREIPNSTYFTAAALAEGMDAYNRRLLEVCEDSRAHCLDLARLVPKTTEFFYDDCHFTDEANRVIASAVADALKGILGSSHFSATSHDRGKQ